MAASGFTPIQLYRTATASAVPSAGNLADGELAINTADGKLFYKDNLGAVQTIANKNNTGTVTSVAMTVPGFLSISGSPITSSGTLAVSYSGTALPVANGGTGLTTTTAYGLIAAGTTATGNFQQVSGTGTSGQILVSNGAGALPSWQNNTGISTGKSIAMAMIFGF